MIKPRILDLFCGAGGAAMGYSRAGFDVTGVDLAPQKRYPFEFIKGDALEFVAEYGSEFDAIHASPPCQQYTVLRSLHKKEYADLLGLSRQALMRTGKPWVIENVIGAPVHSGIVLCGTMFDLRVYRHRWFETSFLLMQPWHPKHIEPTLQHEFRKDWEGFFTVTGGGNQPLDQSKSAMKIDWMTGKELSQAIPPAYTEFIGTQLLAALKTEVAA